jgi:hypothetical protein
MPTIIDRLYREYCRARLAEMRKQLLIRPESQELPEANCDVSQPNGAADRGGNRNETTTAGKFGIGRDSPLCDRSLTPRSRETALSRRCGRQPA